MLKIPVVPDICMIDMADYVRVMLRIKTKQYIAERDIAVEYCPSWDFAQVSIYKWCDAEAGCGTSECRERTWRNQQQGMIDTFDMRLTPSPTWRWLPHIGYASDRTYDLPRDRYVPGWKFFVATESI